MQMTINVEMWVIDPKWSTEPERNESENPASCWDRRHALEHDRTDLLELIPIGHDRSVQDE